MELKIYNQSGILKLTAATSSSSTLNQELMVENAISASFTHFAYVPLDVNDYVILNGVRYSIQKEYKPKQKDTQTYTFSVKFYGPEHDAQRVMYLHLTDGDYEPQFSYDGTPRAHLLKWVENMNRIYGREVWSLGEVVEKPGQNIEYSNTTCWDALTSMSETFETEWWADGYVMNFCRCERGERMELGYMKGLTSLNQSENENDVKFFTRLIPLGSTKNIDRSRYGYNRLQLPSKAKYVDRNTQYGLYEHIEESAFAEIYPHYTGTVTSVRSEEKTDDEGKKFTVYYFHDEDMQFDPNKTTIAELVKRLSFQTGDLAGHGNSENGNYWFDANYNTEKLEWEIINIYPSDDVQIPGGNLIPRPGDKYIPWNFRMPESYEVQAELDYKAAVDNYLMKYSDDISKYGGDTDYTYIDKNKVPLFVGQRVRLQSDKYFSTSGGYRDTRMTKVVRKLDNLSIASIECTDQVGKGWKQVIEQSLANLQYVVATGGGGGSSGGGSSGSTEVTDKLKKNILVNSSDVGYIKRGDVILAGMTWESIFRNMLYKPVGAELQGRVSTGTDVEYGTPKGYLTYTATRNGQGAMKEAYFDGNKENKLNFSAENAGIQEAVRLLSGIYTGTRETYVATVVYGASADGALPQKELTSTISVNVRRKWFAGVCSSVPTSSAQVRALASSGFYTGEKGYDFNVGKWTKMVICIPSGNIATVIKEGTPGNYLESAGVYRGMRNINVEGAGNSQAIPYNMYVFEVDIESDEAKFTFNTVK